jgi:hypothetical protein
MRAALSVAAHSIEELINGDLVKRFGAIKRKEYDAEIAATTQKIAKLKALRDG